MCCEGYIKNKNSEKTSALPGGVLRTPWKSISDSLASDTYSDHTVYLTKVFTCDDNAIL